jgi:hypothetical protein
MEKPWLLLFFLILIGFNHNLGYKIDKTLLLNWRREKTLLTLLYIWKTYGQQADIQGNSVFSAIFLFVNIVLLIFLIVAFQIIVHILNTNTSYLRHWDRQEISRELKNTEPINSSIWFHIWYQIWYIIYLFSICLW